MGYTKRKKSNTYEYSYQRQGGNSQVIKKVLFVAVVLLGLGGAIGGWNLYQNIQKEYDVVSEIEYEIFTKGYSDYIYSQSADQNQQDDGTGGISDGTSNDKTKDSDNDKDSSLQDTQALYYNYSTMSKEMRESYDSVLQCIEQGFISVDVDITDSEELASFMSFIHFDHPELFWFDGAYTYRSTETGYTIFPKYNCEEAEREKRKLEVETAAAEILDQVKSEAGEYAKIKAVFEILIENTDYVTDSADNQNLYSALVNKETVCAGYARAAQYLLQQLGIETHYVTGETDDGTRHGWNIVKCNGKYYQLDVTYGDRYGIDSDMMDSMPESCIYNYYYLCSSDEQMLRNRKYDDFINAPKCESEDLDYYVLNGKYYVSYGDDLLNDLKASLRGGEKFWECRLEKKSDYDAMVADIKNGLFVDLVSDYYKEISRTGSYTTWYINDDTEYTIIFWYE